MTAQRFAESVVEDAALAWLEALGYVVLHGPDISPGGDTLTLTLSQRERESYSEVVLEQRLRDALVRLNPDLPPEALEDAYRKVTRADAPSLVERNRAMHRMLVDGVTVEYRRADGSIAGAQARVIDFAVPDNNDWPAGNANYAWVQHFIRHLAPSGGSGARTATRGSSSRRLPGEKATPMNSCAAQSPTADSGHHFPCARSTRRFGVV